jgi:hypothetical protein
VINVDISYGLTEMMAPVHFRSSEGFFGRQRRHIHISFISSEIMEEEIILCHSFPPSYLHSLEPRRYGFKAIVKRVL